MVAKNKFKFLFHSLHLPIDNNDLKCSNDNNQNDNDDIINLEYSEKKVKLDIMSKKSLQE